MMKKPGKLAALATAAVAAFSYMKMSAKDVSAADLGGAKGTPVVSKDTGPTTYYPCGMKDTCHGWQPETVQEFRMGYGMFADLGYGKLTKGGKTFDVGTIHFGLEREIEGTAGRLSMIARAGLSSSLSNAESSHGIDYTGQYKGYRDDIKESRDYKSVDGQIGLKAKLIKRGDFSLDGYALGGIKHRWQTVDEDITRSFNGQEYDHISRSTKVHGNALTGTLGLQANWELDDKGSQLSAYGEVNGDKAIGKGDNAVGYTLGARATMKFDCIPFLCGDTGKDR